MPITIEHPLLSTPVIAPSETVKPCVDVWDDPDHLARLTERAVSSGDALVATVFAVAHKSALARRPPIIEVTMCQPVAVPAVVDKGRANCRESQPLAPHREADNVRGNPESVGVPAVARDRAGALRRGVVAIFFAMLTCAVLWLALVPSVISDNGVGQRQAIASASESPIAFASADIALRDDTDTPIAFAPDVAAWFSSASGVWQAVALPAASSAPTQPLPVPEWLHQAVYRATATEPHGDLPPAPW